MVMAYLRASELLYNGLVIDNHPAYHVKVVRSNQICMPFLYVCRYSLELSIKLRIRFDVKKTVSGHKLSELYEKLISDLPELKTNIELSVLVENQGYLALYCVTLLWQFMWLFTRNKVVLPALNYLHWIFQRWINLCWKIQRN